MTWPDAFAVVGSAWAFVALVWVLGRAVEE
jgi:hypothetical protein